MVFSSSLFMFIFLPIVYILYISVKNIKLKNLILTIASLLFYSFGRLDWLLILLFSTICNYITGLFMQKSPKIRRISLMFAICINLGFLCVFKYTNFITDNINKLPFINITPTNIALPIGISFFTFQGMSYVIDAYRNPAIISKSFSKLLLYIAFFPQLVAGPIVKYTDIEKQIDQRETSSELTVSGIERFATGLVKKLFFANAFGKISDIVYSLELLDCKLAWLGVLCYTLQIYYDFSAYSDMAIGLGKMFGFHINENFDHPYCATSVKDFWRRWHISLSQWFKDYLYIPLGGNRKGIARARLNRIIVFFFTGLWHGANWTFVIWGLWHGLFLMLEDIVKIKIPVVNRLYTLLVVMIGFMLFRAENINQATNMLCTMFTFSSDKISSIAFFNLLTPGNVITLLAGILFVTPLREKICNKVHMPHSVKLILLLTIIIMCIFKLAASSFNPFIYTQF